VGHLLHDARALLKVGWTTLGAVARDASDRRGGRDSDLLMAGSLPHANETRPTDQHRT
jgi:hypothetical protein